MIYLKKHTHTKSHNLKLYFFKSILFYRGTSVYDESQPFREPYSKFGNIRGFTKAPMLCLTATAGSKLRKRISRLLLLKNPKVFQNSPEKKKVNVVVRTASKSIEDTLSWLAKELKENKEKTDKTIIYCRSLAVCGEVYAILQYCMGDISNAPSLYGMYHSNTPTEIQKKVLELFSYTNGSMRLVIGTSALGMDTRY